jgi:hypothetical protein
MRKPQNLPSIKSQGYFFLRFLILRPQRTKEIPKHSSSQHVGEIASVFHEIGVG